MPKLHANHPLRIFWLSGLITVLLGVIVFYYAAWTGLWLYAVLVLLEVTFSFDNAVINSKVLSKMSRFWQIIFLTLGIFVAVFLIRFALPIVIVMASADISYSNVLNLALNHPGQYSELLHESSLAINAFGGAFLLMISLSYFLDGKKRRHWLIPIERSLSTLTRRLPHIAIGCMLVLIAILFFTASYEHRLTVLWAALLGASLQIALRLIAQIFYSRQSRPGLQVGWAAFASFMYLEILDASFSFDSVVAAFAVTSSVMLIVAGLGVGAVWVRSMTIYLMRSGTLRKYRYLEHGAHWAILALGLVMVAKIYGVNLPEWAIGSIGVAFIGCAVISSIVESRRLSSRHR